MSTCLARQVVRKDTCCVPGHPLRVARAAPLQAFSRGSFRRPLGISVLARGGGVTGGGRNA